MPRHRAGELPALSLAPPPAVQPLKNPVLYALNYLWPRPAVNQVPCPFFTDGEEDIHSTVTPAAVLLSPPSPLVSHLSD